MKTDLLFGRRRLAAELPDEIAVTVVRKRPMPRLERPDADLRQALQSPPDGPPLRELARARKTACILICDITRPVPHGLLLPPLIEELKAGGMALENILIVVATGLHRPNVGDELREVIGSEALFRSVPIANHFAHDREAHADLGRTASGIPILIDRRFAQADLRIAVGLVEPHFMAGYSGGRKLVVPGVAHCDTIFRLHAGGILDHPLAANCVIDGNPVHREQMEVIAAVGEIFALNVAIDEERRVGFVNFGEVRASHAAAVAFVRRYAEVPVGRQFKTVLTTAAGYPLDKTFYQTIKGMVGVIDILEPGGTLVIASECSEGMGSPEFVEAQRRLHRLGPEGFMADVVGRNLARVDEWQTQMLVKALRAGRIELFTTGLTPADLADTCVTPVGSVVAAVVESVRTHRDPHVAMVPEGPYVIPVYRQG
jgi:nickel-dependent lactate racemase